MTYKQLNNKEIQRKQRTNTKNANKTKKCPKCPKCDVKQYDAKQRPNKHQTTYN